MGPLRISAIAYLNTAPLMWDFEHGDAGTGFQVNYTVPSRCAEALRTGTADIGIIPAFAWVQIPDLVAIPDIAIAANGPVRSILLVSKVPVERIGSVALDSSSRTSVALSRVLFAKFWNTHPQFTEHDPNLELMLSQHDAAMLIGDSALRADTTGYYVYDLAAEWKRFSGRQFVFAVWAVRRSALEERGPSTAADVVRIFQNSRDHGLEPNHIAQIAREWAPRVGLTEQGVTDYLTTNVQYHLGSEALEGLRLFLDYSVDLGLLARKPELEFLDADVPARPLV